MTVTGPREIAFLIEPVPHQACIALADIASNRISRDSPLKQGKYHIDGPRRMLGRRHAAAGGSIWAVSSSGGASSHDPRRGAASKRTLRPPACDRRDRKREIQTERVPVEGGPEQEIVTDGSIPLMVVLSLSPNALERGRPLFAASRIAGFLVQCPSSPRHGYRLRLPASSPMT